MRAKSEFLNVFQRFQAFVETQFSSHIKKFQTDGGTELTNHTLQSHLASYGIHHLMSCPYTPAQNGRVERKHRHITEMGLTLLFHSDTPMNLWIEAFSTAVYIINRLPTPTLNTKSPYELVYKQVPLFASFHVFGCKVYLCLHDYVKTKFQRKSLPCVFIGYSPSHKEFRCLEPSTSRVYITCNAQFEGSCFPFRADELLTRGLIWFGQSFKMAPPHLLRPRLLLYPRLFHLLRRHLLVEFVYLLSTILSY